MLPKGPASLYKRTPTAMLVGVFAAAAFAVVICSADPLGWGEVPDEPTTPAEEAGDEDAASLFETDDPMWDDDSALGDGDAEDETVEPADDPAVVQAAIDGFEERRAAIQLEFGGEPASGDSALGMGAMDSGYAEQLASLVEDMYVFLDGCAGIDSVELAASQDAWYAVTVGEGTDASGAAEPQEVEDSALGHGEQPVTDDAPDPKLAAMGTQALERRVDELLVMAYGLL